MLRGGALALGFGALGGTLAGCGAGGLDGVSAVAMDAAGSSLDGYFPGHGAGGFLVEHYGLALDYSPVGNELSGTVSIRIEPSALLSGLSFDCVGPRVSGVAVNGSRAAYTQDTATGKVHITPRTPLGAGRSATIDIAYSVQPKAVQVPGIGRAGWFADYGGSAQDAAVLSMPIGAPTWFPCADHPTLKAAYDFTFTVPSGLSVLANGRLVDTSSYGAGRTLWHYQHDGPMATYLATVQIGTFEVTAHAGPSGVQLRDAYPTSMASQASYDLGRQGEMIQTFARLYGTYPFDVFGTCVRPDLPVSQFGAQTLGLLAGDQVDGRRTHELAVATNVAQQWFGASNSLAEWPDYWQTSGMALHAAWVWAERTGGPAAQQSARAAMAQLARLPQDIAPANPGPQHLTAPQVALRAACYLQTLRTLMGDTTFFEVMQLWAAHGQGGFQGYDDWIQLIVGVYPELKDSSITSDWLLGTQLPQLA